MTDPTVSQEFSGEVQESSGPLPPSPASRPRIRFAAIVWGVVLAALAAVTLLLVTDAPSRAKLLQTVTGMGWSTVALIGALLAGLLVLVLASTAAVRRSQEARAAAPPADPSPADR